MLAFFGGLIGVWHCQYSMHAFAGCDMVSILGGKPTMTLHQLFERSLATTPESVESFIYKSLDRFVTLLHDRASN